MNKKCMIGSGTLITFVLAGRGRGGSRRNISEMPPSCLSLLQRARLTPIWTQVGPRLVVPVLFARFHIRTSDERGLAWSYR